MATVAPAVSGRPSTWCAGKTELNAPASAGPSDATMTRQLTRGPSPWAISSGAACGPGRGCPAAHPPARLFRPDPGGGPPPRHDRRDRALDLQREHQTTVDVTLEDGADTAGRLDLRGRALDVVCRGVLPLGAR